MMTRMPLSEWCEVTAILLEHSFYLILIRTGSFLRKAVLLLRRKGTVRFAAWTDMHLKMAFMQGWVVSFGFMRKELSHGLLQKSFKATGRHGGAAVDAWDVTVLIPEAASVHRS